VRFSLYTEQVGVVVTFFLDLYLRDAQSESFSWTSAILTEVLMVFLSPSRQMPGQYLE
jgi:hypothetical protein